MPVDGTQPVYPPQTLTPITSVWGQAVSDSVVQKFASTTDRTNKWVNPPAGSLSTIIGSGIVAVYRAGAWRDLGEGGFCTATIPSLAWFAPPAGQTEGNPRAFPFANFGAPNNSGFVAGNGNTTITLPVTGWYNVQLSVAVTAAWNAYVGVRQIRATTPVGKLVQYFSRGTWGNPPGVNGFDSSYINPVCVQGMVGATAGDLLQLVIWTGGGADATSLVGDNGGFSNITVTKVG